MWIPPFSRDAVDGISLIDGGIIPAAGFLLGSRAF